MPRAAGSSTHYTFYLYDEGRGRVRKDVGVSLPSVTHIVGTTLAKPGLVGWAYRHTRDVIAGLLSFADDETIDLIKGDGDALEEWLRDNRLRPVDVRDDRAQVGSAAHDFLERLAKTAMRSLDDAAVLANLEASSKDPYKRAVAGWWASEARTPVASEVVLPCWKYGYCGTVDLVWYDGQGSKVLTDLKTRRKDLSDYANDHFQVDAYRIAYDLLQPDAPIDRATVLVAHDDGTWEEVPTTLRHGAFLRLKGVYDELERGNMLSEMLRA